MNKGCQQTNDCEQIRRECVLVYLCACVLLLLNAMSSCTRDTYKPLGRSEAKGRYRRILRKGKDGKAYGVIANTTESSLALVA